MPRTVTASEAQNNFSAMLQWAEENRDEVVVEKRGKPAAVIITYEEYQEITKMRQQERKRQALQALRELRKEIRRQNPDVTAEEAYRLAGFSEEVIQETLESDRQLANQRP